MQVTNRFNLPQPLLNLIERDDYSRGAARISVTQLIAAPRLSILREKHQAQIVTDASEMLWSLVGRALHKILEDGADERHIAEERLFATVNGWRISGGIDLRRLEDGGVVVSDWKFTSAWAVMAQKPEWAQQLNVYRWLAIQHGERVDGLQINALVRDFSRHKVGTEGYPAAPMVVVPIPIWDDAEIESYILGRVRLHQDAARAAAWDELLPPCTDDDRWIRKGTFAVKKPGAKKASKIFEDHAAAVAYIGDRDMVIEQRGGEPTRCLSFCPVSEFCDQHKAWLAENNAPLTE